jgi:hypothetical protein
MPSICGIVCLKYPLLTPQKYSEFTEIIADVINSCRLEDTQIVHILKGFFCWLTKKHRGFYVRPSAEAAEISKYKKLHQFHASFYEHFHFLKLSGQLYVIHLNH